MKKVILSLFVLASVSFGAMAQATETAAKPSNAEVAFEKDVHDYGTIKMGANGDYEFKFTNTGKEPLIITDAKGSCGCTVPTYSKEPLRPGQTGSIKVNYDTKRIGAFTKTVTITSNAKTNPTKILTIKGVVDAEAPAETSPVKKIEMGATPMESAPSKKN